MPQSKVAWFSEAPYNQPRRFIPLPRFNRAVTLGLLGFFLAACAVQTTEQSKSTSSQGNATPLQHALESSVGEQNFPDGEAADKAALIALYDATNGDTWKNKTNWNSDAPLGEWYGVDTDSSGRVTYLSLLDNGLTGSIPAALGNLSSLKILNLGFNELTGSIPTALGNLNSLIMLDLAFNRLRGTIPVELGNLSNLGLLSLTSNSLTGRIPAALGNLTKLETLYLNDNQLTGRIPAALGNLTKLETLYLHRNQLTGRIPAALGNLTNLTKLDLSGNQLTGSIPAALKEALKQ